MRGDRALSDAVSRPGITGNELGVARAPDLFIVGQSESGNTALYDMLRRHPEILMPDIKEPMFLATDLRPRFPGPRVGSLRPRWKEYLASLPTMLEEYLARFEDATPDQQLGEASVLGLLSVIPLGRSIDRSAQPGGPHHCDLP